MDVNEGQTNSYERMGVSPSTFLETSMKVDKLQADLIKAQKEMGVAKTNSDNPFFKSKYADYSAIVSASRESLASNNIGVTQHPNHINGKSFLVTRIMHSSGQWMQSAYPIEPVKKDVQALGSEITYLKRYNYAASVGVVTSGEDDDGEKAMARKGTTSKTADRMNTKTVDRMKDFERRKI